MKYLRYLLVFVPIAVLAEVLGWSPVIIFGWSCIALIPLAGLLGEATEELAIHTDPKVGGLLNATLGNAAECCVEGRQARPGQSLDHRFDPGQPVSYEL